MNNFPANAQQSPNGANDNQEDGPIFFMPPPPEKTYTTEEEMEKALHDWSRDHGYELVRRASKKNAKGEVYKRYYHCSKYGQETKRKTTEPRRRTKRISNRIGCPMSIACVAADPSNPDRDWQIRHRKSHHNHAPLEAVQLAGHRRRARMVAEKAVDSLFEMGTSTSLVLKFLQTTHPDGLFTRTDVANMKLKWKKWGTCADKLQSIRKGTAPTGKHMESVCLACRGKRIACGRERPVCGNCELDGRRCEYDHEPAQHDDDDQHDLSDEVPPTQINYDQQRQRQHQSDAIQRSTPNRGRMSGATQKQTQEILSTLQQFTQEHIKPTRLTTQSSSVQVLAQSSCGDGKTYERVPSLNAERDWPAFRDGMFESSLKEGTYDVLTGTQDEPERPRNDQWKEGEAAEIDAWNEYVKQLAIHKRRSDMLFHAFYKKLGPAFRSRIQALQKPAEVWALLESVCQPRGSEQAYRLFCDIQSISLANSEGLRDYVNRLDTAYSQFKELKINSMAHQQPAGVSGTGRSTRPKNRAQTGKDAIPDEMMVFLFLKGLGSDWARWVEGLCATNNIAGFGTGDRLGFQEVCKRALGYEAMQRRE